MNHEQIRELASKHGLGQVHFQFNVAQNTGREFEVGYVSVHGHRELFCKRSYDSNPDQFYLCNEYAKLVDAESIRDKKLEEIAQEVLDVPTLTLRNPFTEARVKLVDLKQALQLAFQAGRDSK